MNTTRESSYPTTEAYFIDRDLFVKYVLERVNPARRACGLEECTEGIARSLFDVMDGKRYRQSPGNSAT